jgi:tRNA threonylcarbamoyl adenosine modification protein YjeE
MMRGAFTARVDEEAMAPLAGLLAFCLAPGDVVALSGELGTGKTAFARSLIRAALGDDRAEVPSPTFALAEAYDTPKGRITHFDFYRLPRAEEAREIGFEEAVSTGAVVVEWPERAIGLMPADRLEVRFTETDGGARRLLSFEGYGDWAARLDRLAAMRGFLDGARWGGARVRHLKGDASTRRYARLSLPGRTMLLMDAPRQPDGPPIRDGRPYSRIAHLAEDVVPYAAVSAGLRGRGLSAPRIDAQDLARGLLLIEDLGDRVFSEEIRCGADQAELWRAAVDALLALRSRPLPPKLPVGDGTSYVLPAYDRDALGIETELLIDWYLPALNGAPATASARSQFNALWSQVLASLLRLPQVPVLRDYHSPNLIWLPERQGVARVGIIDFQDAVVGHAAYDLVSLLQDARVDVPAELEAELCAHYMAAAKAEDPAFDENAFEFAYSALGAQRNTKILGIFTRLARRDGKPAYLQHMPRIWRYLERNLAHAALHPLTAWYDAELPDHLRASVL